MLTAADFTLLAKNQMKQMLANDIPAEQARVTADHIAQLGNIVHEYEKAVEQIRQDRELTNEGKQTRYEALVRATGDKIVPFADLTRDWEREIAERRRRASAGVAHAKGDSIRDVFTLLQEREIRDRLMTVSPAVVISKYLAAVDGGHDTTFVSAVENAPQAFPVVDEVTRAKADAIRLELSADGPVIAVLDYRRSVLQHAVAEATKATKPARW